MPIQIFHLRLQALHLFLFGDFVSGGLKLVERNLQLRDLPLPVGNVIGHGQHLHAKMVMARQDISEWAIGVLAHPRVRLPSSDIVGLMGSRASRRMP